MPRGEDIRAHDDDDESDNGLSKAEDFGDTKAWATPNRSDTCNGKVSDISQSTKSCSRSDWRDTETETVEPEDVRLGLCESNRVRRLRRPADRLILCSFWRRFSVGGIIFDGCCCRCWQQFIVLWLQCLYCLQEARSD
jgi:hypothetical protein